MDAAWIGVIGTVGGGVIGIMATLATQAMEGRRAAEVRHESTAREDEVRYLTERRELYVAYLTAVALLQRLLSYGSTNPDALRVMCRRRCSR